MILSSILPGVRQLRAPLAAGYLWILFVFLVIHLGNGEPHTDMTRDLARLGEALSPAGLAVAVSFAAYLIGSLSQGVSQSISRWVGRWSDYYRTRRLTPRGLEGLEDLLTPRAVTGLIASPDEARDLADEVIDELDLVKSRMLQTEQELHNEVDRLHAEADFIQAVLPPLVALGVFAALQITATKGALLLIIGVFVVALVSGRQGLHTYQRANDKIVDAIFLEQVRSPALDRWDQDVKTRA